MEVAKMGSAIYVEDHFFLRPLAEKLQREGLEKGLQKGLQKGLEKGLEEGREKGRVEGRTEGMAALLTQQLRAKFGLVPRWAQTRLKGAKPTQIERWATKLITADTLEGVIGRRR